jgi:hypothetical protein
MIDRIQQHLGEGRDVFAYFKHEETPEGAMYARELLGGFQSKCSAGALARETAATSSTASLHPRKSLNILRFMDKSSRATWDLPEHFADWDGGFYSVGNAGEGARATTCLPKPTRVCCRGFSIT